MATLYLLRHGAIDWPVADCFIGQTDASLNSEGRRQAEAWRIELEKKPFSVIWSSDLARAVETAGIVFSGREGSVGTCRELREINLGRWEGLPRSRVRTDFPDLWLARGHELAGFRPPGGESFRDLQERVVPVVDRLAAEAGGDVCLVTHAGVIRVLICHYLQIPLGNLFRIRLDYGSMSIVSYSAPRFEVCALNLQPSNRELFPWQGNRRKT